MITGVFIGVFVFLLFFLVGDFRSIVNTLSKINFVSIIITLIISALGYCVRYWKWSYLLKKVGVKISTRDSFNIYWIGRAMSITPGKIGELLKVHCLKKHNKTELAQSSPVILSEWITDLFGIMFLIGVGITLFSYGLIFFIVVFLGLTVILLILQRPSLSVKIIDCLCKLEFFNKRKDSILEFYQNAHTLFKFKPLMVSTTLSIIAWFSDCLSLYIFTKSLNIDLSILHDVFIFSFGTLAGAISMLPGGMGVSEVSMTGMFLSFGVDKTLAISLTLIIRVITLWLGVIVGLLVFFKNKSRYI